MEFPIVGSEIVGLTPLQALVDVADHYLRLEKFTSSSILEKKVLDFIAGQGKVMVKADLAILNIWADSFSEKGRPNKRQGDVLLKHDTICISQSREGRYPMLVGKTWRRVST